MRKKKARRTRKLSSSKRTTLLGRPGGRWKRCKEEEIIACHHKLQRHKVTIITLEKYKETLYKQLKGGDTLAKDCQSFCFPSHKCLYTHFDIHKYIVNKMLAIEIIRVGEFRGGNTFQNSNYNFFLL